jgi:hypothetical protein
MKRFLLMTAVLFGFSLAMVPAVGSVTHAQNPIQQGVDATCSGSKCTTSAEGDIKGLVADIINIFSWVVGVVSVIMIIFGGFRYITSGGEAGKVTSAKNTIVYALVGLVIVALAQVIVLFVLGNVT